MITPYSTSANALPLGYPGTSLQPNPTAMIPTMPTILPGLLAGLNTPAPTPCTPAPTTPPNSAVNIQVYANTPSVPAAPAPATPAFNNANSLAQALLANAGQPIPGSVQQVAQDVYQRALISQLQAQRDASTYSALMNQLQGLSAANNSYATSTAPVQTQPSLPSGLGAYNMPQGQVSQPQATPYDPYSAQVAGLGAYGAPPYAAPQGQVAMMPQATPAQTTPYDPYSAQIAGLGAYGIPPYGAPQGQVAMMPQVNQYDPYGALASQLVPTVASSPLASLSPEQLVESLKDPNKAAQALAEISGRGRIDNPEGYQAIASIIQNPSDPNRVMALQTLGQLNASQNSTLNRAQEIPGFSQAQKILLSKNESPETKSAALGVLTPYYQIPQVNQLLKKATSRTNGNAQLNQQITDAIGGMAQPASATQGGFPGYLA